MPDAAACVSVGELSAALGLFGPRELRAMRMCDGFVVIVLVLAFRVCTVLLVWRAVFAVVSGCGEAILEDI